MMQSSHGSNYLVKVSDEKPTKGSDVKQLLERSRQILKFDE